MMTGFLIPFNKPSIVGRELDYLSEAIRRGRLSGDGHYTRLCSERLWLPLRGRIDYESGTFARSPVWITEWGLEWLYRPLKEPHARFHRYVVHGPPFVWVVLKRKLGVYRDPFGDKAMLGVFG